jgi:hypothetical protein
MDEFTSRVEELNSKLTVKKHLPSQQNLALPNDATCNGSTPTNLFVSQLGNGTLIPHSSSSNQLAKDSPMIEEVSLPTPSFFFEEKPPSIFHICLN